MDDYAIRFITLPHTVKGVTVMDNDGFYNVYINSQLSIEEQRKAIKHELEHIGRADFDRILVPLEIVEAM